MPTIIEMPTNMSEKYYQYTIPATKYSSINPSQKFLAKVYFGCK